MEMAYGIIAILVVTNLITFFGFFRARQKYQRFSRGIREIESLCTFREQLERMGRGTITVHVVNRDLMFEWSPKA